jgi:MFS family permease
MGEPKKSDPPAPGVANAVVKPKTESDPLFWGSLCLLAAVLLAIPGSYYLQSNVVQQLYEYNVWAYAGKVAVSMPYFFKEWPEKVAPGSIIRLTLILAAAGGMVVGFFAAFLRNLRLRRTQARAEVSPEDRKVGTLAYTKVGLIMMFFWMLWGDFCFRMMETIFPAIMPLQLGSEGGLGATNTAMGVLMSTLPALLAFPLVPIISFKSDRFRSRWGRRIPFIVVTAPFLVLFLGLLGYTTEIGNWVKQSNFPAMLGVKPMTLTLAVVGFFIVGFQFFNLFVNSVFWYLFADVIPKKYFARFNAMFVLVGNVAGFVFNTYIFGHAMKQITIPFFNYTMDGNRFIYWGAGLLYLFGFGLMCFRVKEGQYPPPEDVAGPSTSRLRATFKSVGIFFKECFTHPFFICLFLFNAMWTVTNLTNAWKIFYFRDSLHLTLDQMGAIGGILGVAAIFLAYIYGYIIDIVHPVRTMLIAIILLIPITVAGAFISDFNSYLIVMLVTSLVGQLFDSSSGPMMLNLLPRERYGQFSAANAIFRTLVAILGPVVAGPIFDYLTVGADGTKIFANYRYTFYWQAAFMVPALAVFLFVFFYWVRHGGKHNYVPPDTTVKVRNVEPSPGNG